VIVGVHEVLVFWPVWPLIGAIRFLLIDYTCSYCLMASLIEIFLHLENVPRHCVLTTFAKRLTGFKITDTIELEAGEPHISPNLDRMINSYQPLTELRRLFKEEGLLNSQCNLSFTDSCTDCVFNRDAIDNCPN
jgi:hypothetical protein